MKDFTTLVNSDYVGKTSIFFVGQAGFIIKSSSGQLVAIDLYLSNCVERYEGNVGYKRLVPELFSPGDLIFDFLICTHPHLDHLDLDSFPCLMNNGTTIAMCSIECEKFINDLHLRDCSDRIYYIKPFDSFDFGDIKIDFVNCDHGVGAPDAVGVVIHVDGKTIYETGDTCLRLDRINEIPKDLDILIAPINGSFGNLDESECVQLAKALQPKMTIPCHYGMFASHHGDVGKFYEKMIENDLPFYIFQYGEGIVI